MGIWGCGSVGRLLAFHINQALCCIPVISALGSEVQGHPGIYSEFEASLGYMRQVSQNDKKCPQVSTSQFYDLELPL